MKSTGEIKLQNVEISDGIRCFKVENISLTGEYEISVQEVITLGKFLQKFISHLPELRKSTDKE